MAAYRFTRRAEQDLLDIFLYGLTTFGLRQAESYRDGLAACFTLLAEHPGLGGHVPRSGRTFGVTSMPVTLCFTSVRLIAS